MHAAFLEQMARHDLDDMPFEDRLALLIDREITLARLRGPHRLQDALAGNPSVKQREPAVLPPGSEELEHRHVRTSLEDVDLGFAGRQDSRRPVHRAIAALSPGDPLKTRVVERGCWELVDGAGTVVGRLARSFTPPVGTRCRAAEVFAIVRWSREASEPQYRDSIKSETWEVIVPDLVFEPDGLQSHDGTTPGPGDAHNFA